MLSFIISAPFLLSCKAPVMGSPAGYLILRQASDDDDDHGDDDSDGDDNDQLNLQLAGYLTLGHVSDIKDVLWSYFIKISWYKKCSKVKYYEEIYTDEIIST